jgi:putative endonuclease
LSTRPHPWALGSVETRTARGNRAEGLACEHLTTLGYRVVTRNFRCREGEIDIIAFDGPTLCFVEVRARTPSRFGSALETITPLKMRRVIRAARAYARTLVGPWPPMRFDAVGIELTDPPRFEVIRGAFEA